MTRRRKRGLTAKLSPGRRSVLCGRCERPIAYVAMVRDEYRDRSGWGDPYRVLRFDAGWRLDAHDVWVLPPKAQARLARGRSPYEHRQWWREPAVGAFGGKEPTRLPVEAACPACRSSQTLDAAALDVHPGDRVDEVLFGAYVIVPGRRPEDG